MSPESKNTTEEIELSPEERQKKLREKQDKLIASLADRRDFDHMEDRVTFLNVKRNPDGEHDEPWPDSGWMIVTTGIDERGVRVGVLEKQLNPDDERPSRKIVKLEEAMAYSAEVARTKTPQIELADQALLITGPVSPGEVEPFDDPFSNAMSREEVAAIRAEAIAGEGTETRAELTPVELMEKLTDGMSEQDKDALRNYAYGREDKHIAQNNGNGQASTEAGYAMGDAIKRMSPAANTIKNQFANYYERSQS